MLEAETVGEGVEVDMMARRSSRWFFCNLYLFRCKRLDRCLSLWRAKCEGIVLVG